MTDSHLLRYIIRKNNDTVDGLAYEMGLSRTALSAKINNRAEFRQSEIFFIAARYGFNAKMSATVFFNGGVCI